MDLCNTYDLPNLKEAAHLNANIFLSIILFLFSDIPFLSITIFIGPQSDHWECLSLTHSLTDCCLVNLIDVTLACEDGNSKLVEVVTVAHVDAEDHVDNSLLQI